MSFQPVNTELDRVSKEIELVSEELAQARTDYLLEKAKYENEFSRNLLETKLRNPDMTQS